MSKTYISPALRQRVEQTADHRCSYCQTQAALIGRPLEVDHIIPEALGGVSDESNLCLACSTCNQYKGSNITGIDPVTGDEVTLFNPRTNRWPEHFIWEANDLYIAGLTAGGRATVAVLNMNNAYIVRTRRTWIEWRVHPP